MKKNSKQTAPLHLGFPLAPQTTRSGYQPPSLPRLCACEGVMNGWVLC